MQLTWPVRPAVDFAIRLVNSLFLTCLTWDQAQFEQFSYILSNGYRVLPAGM